MHLFESNQIIAEFSSHIVRDEWLINSLTPDRFLCFEEIIHARLSSSIVDSDQVIRRHSGGSSTGEGKKAGHRTSLKAECLAPNICPPNDEWNNDIRVIWFTNA
jgi:hypothetical protein